VIFFTVTLAGYIGTKYIRNPFFGYFEKLIERAPLMKIIYSSVKDLITAFVGEKKRFNHPVLVKSESSSQTQRIGFITSDDLTNMRAGKKMSLQYIYRSPTALWENCSLYPLRILNPSMLPERA